MLNMILLILSAVLIPVIGYSAIKTYEPKYTYKSALKGLIISLLVVALFRFFYSASLYENAFLPAKELTFSYLSLLIIFGLIAVFNKDKYGQFFEKLFVLTALIPAIFPLFATRIYLNPEDVHFVTTALYFVETGLVTTIALFMLLSKKINFTYKDVLISAGVFLSYMVVAILLNFGWRLEIPFDFKFYLGYGLSLLSIFAICGSLKLKNRLINKKEVTLQE